MEQTVRTSEVSIPDEIVAKWQTVVNILADIVHVPAALIMKVDPPYIEVFRSSDSDGNPYHAGDREHLAGLYCEQVITSGEKLLVPNALQDPAWNQNPDIKLGMISYLGFPLLWPDGKVFGTICVLDRKENRYSEEYKALLRQFKELIESHIGLLYQRCELERAITEREQAKQSLQESEERFRRFSDAAFEGIAIHDNGVIIDVNQAYAAIFGYEQSEVIGMHVLDFAAPESRNLVMKNVLAGYEQPYEFIGQRKDGSTFVSEVHGKAIPYEGRSVRVTAVRDITERKRLEEALEHSKAEWESTFDAMSDWVCLLDIKTRNVLRTNQAGAAYVGMPLAEIAGKHCCTLIHGIEENIPDCPLTRMLHTHHRESAEVQLPDSDRWVMVTVDPVMDTDGNLVSAVHIVRDITKRRLAGQALRESEEKYRVLVENAADMIFMIDEQYKVLSLNRAAAGALGKTQEEIVGKSIFDLYPQHVATSYAENLQQIFQTGEGHISESIMIMGDRELWISTSLNPVKSHEGHVVAVLGVARDISERKRVEESLQQRVQEMAALNILGRQVSATLSLDQVVDAALDGITTSVAPDLALLFLRKGDELRLVNVTATKPELSREETPVNRAGECLCELAIHQEKALFFRDIISDSLCTWEECKKAGLRSFAALPLRSGDEIIGVLGVASTTERDFAKRATFLETIASEVAIGVQNARLYEQVQRYAEDLEQRVAERTAELQRFVNLMAGREVRMAELKDVIRQLRAQLREAGLAPIADDPLFVE